MYLEIVTPDKTLFSGDVRLVQFPGSLGSFEVLKKHAPLISTLSKGVLKAIDLNDKIIQFEIASGVVENLDDNIIVLADLT